MEMIQLNEIKINNSYLRLDTDVSELERSIETVGLIAPLILNKDKKLLAGGRRFRALKNIGRSSAQAIIVDNNSYEQELISIDENLVRKDLNKLEVEANLRRAKELYTIILKDDSQQFALAHKDIENIQDENLLKEIGLLKEDEDGEVETIASQKFVKDITEKTGMSAKQVDQAIKRDEKSSKAVKSARGRGELNVSQTNEIIKLSEEDQKKILPVIGNKTTAEVRRLIKESRTHGVDAAIQSGETDSPHAREIGEISKSIKKMHKICKSLELEGIELEGDQADKVKARWIELSESMNKLFSEY